MNSPYSSQPISTNELRPPNNNRPVKILFAICLVVAVILVALAAFAWNALKSTDIAGTAFARPSASTSLDNAELSAADAAAPDRGSDNDGSSKPGKAPDTMNKEAAPSQGIGTVDAQIQGKQQFTPVDESIIPDAIKSFSQQCIVDEMLVAFVSLENTNPTEPALSCQPPLDPTNTIEFVQYFDKPELIKLAKEGDPLLYTINLNLNSTRGSTFRAQTAEDTLIITEILKDDAGVITYAGSNTDNAAWTETLKRINVVK